MQHFTDNNSLCYQNFYDLQTNWSFAIPVHCHNALKIAMLLQVISLLMTVAIFSHHILALTSALTLLWRNTVTNFFFSMSSAFEAFSNCWHHNNTKLEGGLQPLEDAGDDAVYWLENMATTTAFTKWMKCSFTITTFTLFSFNISACGFVQVGPQKITTITIVINQEGRCLLQTSSSKLY